MSKFYRFLLAIVLVSGVSFQAFSQQGYWSARNDKTGIITDKAVARQSFPKDFLLFNLDINPLRQELFSIVGNQTSRHSTIISIPNAEGAMEQFEVYEASNFEPALQARFPEIRAFSGRGITDKGATLKLSISPYGIQTMVFRTEKKNEFIEAYSADHSVYAVFKSSREKGALPWTCSTQDQQIFNNITNTLSPNRIESSTGELKTMRLAQSCNGEYSNYFGAFNSSQVNLVLAAFNATLSRCNGCYEKDLAIHLNLINNTTDVIFYDPLTDPYTTMANWNNQLQTTLTNIIGEANYDIGHMFGASGGGGNAGCIGCVCVDGTKGRGITSPADGIPQGDNFDIDYVVHEVGHQLGANHTFSHSLESGGVNNKEVGSGITIMGYAGITSRDVAPHSIDIFHQNSIQQIQVNMATKSCPVTTLITPTNATPVVSPMGPFTIPFSTPFALTGVATDANPGDVLTYCWEQNDAANSTVTGANSIAFPTKLVGPNWLSFSPTTSPTRLFPRLSTILTGADITPVLPGGDPGTNIEALSSVARTLNFRLTVRDNCPYSSSIPLKVGQTSFTDVVVNVNGAIGPFLITSQNSAVSYEANSTQTVTWSVNGTTGAPINCANVKISFSTDGGNTFPFVLSASTANDGTEIITIPSTLTSTGRIKVEAADNIFFDINNANITVTPPPSGFTFGATTPTVSACPAASTLDVNLSTTSIGGFTNTITLSATAGVPAGTTISFVADNTPTPGQSRIVRLNNANTLPAGTYNVTIQGVATGAATQNAIVTFTINPGTGPAITVQPSNQTICASANTSFSVTSATATAFQWQVSTDGGVNYTNISNGGFYSGATTATLTITGATLAMNNYRYRVIASVQCGSTTSTAAILSVNAAPAVTTHPQSITLCAGSSHTFTSASTGVGLTYQWEQSTNGCAGPWTPISGANTSSYTIGTITVGMNNTGYRVVVSGTCSPSATSNCALLTVVTSVSVTTQPTNATVCDGSNTSFTVAGSGTGVIYQWQVSTNGGANYTDVTNTGVYSGAQTATLTITGAIPSMNGYMYRAQLSNSTCTTPGVSNAATLTVNTLPAITTNPPNRTICLGGNTTFTGAATGTGVGYQWQVSTDGGATYTNITNGGVYAGATTSTLTITGVTAAMNNYRYRFVATGVCPPAANSTGGILTVINPVSIATAGQPSNAEVCSGSSATFTVTGTSVEPITYQWQDSTAAHTWQNIAGATASSYTVANTTTAMSGNKYRVLVNNNTCTSPTTSNAAILTVRQLPTVTLTATTTSLLPGQSATLTATPSASTGGTLSTTWTYNNNPLLVTGNTYVANIEKVGDYRVNIQETWPSGLICSNQSSVVTLVAEVSNRLFIFPSPNDGRFTVSYYNSNTTNTSRTVTIFDSKGAKVYHAKFNITGAYTLLPINIQTSSRGVYHVVIGDASGKRITKGSVVVN